jgi:hypothetical protein
MRWRRRAGNTDDDYDRKTSDGRPALAESSHGRHQQPPSDHPARFFVM